MTVRSVHLEVEPDFGQFYLMRRGAGWASDKTTSEGYERKLWTDGSFVTVGTYRKFGTTQVQVEVLDAPPAVVDPQAQHIVEVGLDGGAPQIEVLSWGEDVPVGSVDVSPSPLRVRCHWRGLVADRFEGLDEDGNSDESLVLLVWPSEDREARILRAWPPWDLPPPAMTSSDGRRQIEGTEAVMERLGSLENVARGGSATPLPGSEGGSVYAVLFDRSEQTWWADGNDIRRTLREVTEAEARELAARLLGA